jgi:hypothetical protein
VPFAPSKKAGRGETREIALFENPCQNDLVKANKTLKYFDRQSSV